MGGKCNLVSLYSITISGLHFIGIQIEIFKFWVICSMTSCFIVVIERRGLCIATAVIKPVNCTLAKYLIVSECWPTIST